MIRLLLVRHGQTLWNAEKRYQGQTDVPLSELGRQQAEALGRRLAGERIDAIYASDLQRAYDTALAIAVHHGVPVRADPRLREMNFGFWEGLTWDEIEARYPESAVAWREMSMDTSPPGGESRAQVRERIAELIDDLRRRHDGQSVAVVGHGGSLLMFLSETLRLPRSAFWRFRFSHAGLSEVYLYEDTAVLSLLNDRCHLNDLNEVTTGLGSSEAS